MAAFGALQNRNFRLFWIGMLISMIGTLTQITAQSWLVLELTDSPLILGLIGAAHATPFLLFALIGGNTADRVNKRKLLYVTQSVMMVLALILGLLVLTEKVKVWHIAMIAVGMGIANSFDMPARQAFVFELVGKEDILSAVSLDSILFNLSMIAGPAIAGIVVACFGNAWCFLMNSVSFLAFIIALKMMVVNFAPIHKMEGSTLKNIKEGLHYVRKNSTLKTIIIIAALCTIFAMPFGILMPIFARDILKVGAKGFGFLMTCSGIGALAGGLIMGGIGDIRKKGKLLLAGTMTLSITIILFSASKIFYLSCILLVISGLSIIIQSSISNTLVQIITPDKLRGRIMGIYSLAFMGLSPLGSLQAGAIAQFFGAPFAIALGAASFGIITFFIFKYTPHLRKI
jgi:MFS family permease